MVHTELPTGLNEVDVIIVGGGVAGSVVAARLADANRDATILVLERGPDNYDDPTVIHPALYRANFDPSKGTMLFYMSGVEEQLANRPTFVGAGGLLGGGSSVNGMIYGRGQRVDYDSWATEGWSSNDLIPYLKKLETYFPGGEKTTHGTDGPTAISSGMFRDYTLRDDFVSAAAQLGCPYIKDVQDLDSSNAVSAAYRYVDPTTGRRQDAANVYLHPRLRDAMHNNLHVIVQAHVFRVIFDGDCASGVEFKINNSTKLVKARKLIVLSAGPLGTPQILERSGVGNPDVLKTAGVPVIVDLPGVGHDYQDHQMLVTIYNSSLTIEQSVDSIVNGNMNVSQLIDTNADILSWNGIETFAKLRPNDAEIKDFAPGLRKMWDRDYAQNLNKPLGIIIPMAGILGDPSAYSARDQYFSMACFSTYPYSRGHVHITGSGLEDPLDFKTGWLKDSNGADLQTLVWLYKKQRQLAKRMKIRREQVSPPPKYVKGSKASEEVAFSPDSGEDIIYSAADNAAIEQMVRETVQTAFHSMGTCKMAPREKMGVVDPSLGVYGTKNLKIADLSIAPENVSGNTMNAALLIGEKAADIFIQELGWTLS